MAHSVQVRRRKHNNTTSFIQSNEGCLKRDNSGRYKKTDHSANYGASLSGTNVLCYLWDVLGVLLCLYMSYRYNIYVGQQHENQLWFTKIKEVEREISFRTESGLYYSYYKQLVNAPSIRQGLYELSHDNHTEHPSTINVLARMNVYQEVLLAVLYRTLPTAIQSGIEPIYFYINSVFCLHGLLVCSLYVMTWLLSGTWLAGVLAVCFYVFNRDDTTRVAYMIPLRESFSLPFLWVQLAAVTNYFRPHITLCAQRLSLLCITMATFCFALCWQFNQFVLLLQAMALFGVQVLGLVPHYKILNLYLAQLFSLLLVCLLQFFNPMILTGHMVSFLLSAIIVMKLQTLEWEWLTSRSGLMASVLRASSWVLLVFILTFIINTSIKATIKQEADEHIIKFLMAKFALGDSRDFDVRLYLCNGAFGFLTPDVFQRLSSKLVLPVYTLVHLSCLGLVAAAATQIGLRNKEVNEIKDSSQTEDISEAEKNGRYLSQRPDLAYHTIQVVFFGALALTTIRMKFLWTPYMCVLAAMGVSDKTFWTWLLHNYGRPSSIGIEVKRHIVTVSLLAAFLYMVVPPAVKELEELREFYDPDTVDLMNWIKSSTPATAALSGSMQLMAGVKLCTGRPITNHPHYEDKALRLKTKELYQMYGRKSAYQVHSIMLKYNASYIILEDSICMSPSNTGCGLPDLIDMDNGHVTDKGKLQPGLVKSSTPRFCNEVRHMRPPYAHFFKLVFKNKTFRVYMTLMDS